MRIKQRDEEAKDQVMAYKATMTERRIVEAEAEKQGMNSSGYIRSAVLMTMVLDGNAQALGLAGREVRERVVERLKAWLEGSSQTMGKAHT